MYFQVGDYCFPIQWRRRSKGCCIAYVKALGLVGAGEDECSAMQDLAKQRDGLLVKAFAQLVRQRMQEASA